MVAQYAWARSLAAARGLGGTFWGRWRAWVGDDVVGIVIGTLARHSEFFRRIEGLMSAI